MVSSVCLEQKYPPLQSEMNQNIQATSADGFSLMFDVGSSSHHKTLHLKLEGKEDRRSMFYSTI